MTDSSDYRKAYETAQRELADLLQIQEGLEKRIVLVRQNVQSLKELCESEEIKVPTSQEAEWLLLTSSLPDEIVNILRARYPDELRATDIRQQLERLGHDFSRYTNPLATIHMVIKRLLEANRVRERQHAQGFRIYQFRQPTIVRVQPGLDPDKVPEAIRQYLWGTGKSLPKTRIPKAAPERTRPRKTIGERMMERDDKK